MSKLPYFPCYARDILSSNKIALMSGDAFKACWLLTCYSWLEDERATLPNDEAKLQALARVDATTWARIRLEVLDYFKGGANGRIFSPRLMEISSLHEKRSNAGSKGGSKTQANRAVKVQALESESKSKKKKTKSSATKAAPESEKCYLTFKKRRLRGVMLEAFDQFWKAWGVGYKKDRAKAADAWLSIDWPAENERKRTLLLKILKAARAEALDRPYLLEQKKTPIYPEGWLSHRRWEDE